MINVQIAQTTDERYIATSPDLRKFKGYGNSIEAAVGKLLINAEVVKLDISKGAINQLMESFSKEKLVS
jgi:hypothetical protein